MAENTDLDLAIALALAESNEVLSDDDFKSSVRSVGLNQQHLLKQYRSSCRIPKKKQLKKKPDKNEDLSRDGTRPKKARKDVIKGAIIPRQPIPAAKDDVKRMTSFSLVDLDSFRFTGGRLGDSPDSEEAVPLMGNEEKPDDVTIIKATSITEVGSPEAHAEKISHSDSAADPTDKCLVIDIGTDEVVELSNESQFSVLLQLCSEEYVLDELGTDGAEMDPVPKHVDLPPVHCISARSNDPVENSEGPPGCDAVEAFESIVEAASPRSCPSDMNVDKDAAPTINISQTHLSVTQQDDDIEGQALQDQFSEDDTDDISSMMTQKCLPRVEECKAHESPLSDLNVDMDAAPVIHFNQTELSVTPEGKGIEGEALQDQLSEDNTDDISSMMSQKCIPRLEEGKARSSPSRDLNVDKDAPPAIHIREAVLSANQQGKGIEGETLQDQMSEDNTDDVSSRISEKCIPQLEEGKAQSSRSSDLNVDKDAPPAIHISEAVLSANQQGKGIEEEALQDQLSEDNTDDISCMMSQKCIPRLEEGKARSSPSRDLNVDKDAPPAIHSSEADLSANQHGKGTKGETLQDQLCEFNTDDNSSLMSQKCLPQSEEGKAQRSPSDFNVDKDAAPVINNNEAVLSVTQQGKGTEGQTLQDQLSEDNTNDISSMMTQKCLPQSEEGKVQRSPNDLNVGMDVAPVTTQKGLPQLNEGKAPDAVSPLPLQNISNLSTRSHIDRQSTKAKTSFTKDRGDSSCMDTEAALSKNETVLTTRSGLQAHQMRVSNAEDHCPNTSIMGGSHGWITVVKQPEVRVTIKCPVCGCDISDFSVEMRGAHTNSCLDKLETSQGCPEEVAGNAPAFVPTSDQVKIWLETLSLSRYASLFVEQEIDWETLQWLTEEDLVVMGIAAIGPRRKILQALQELKSGSGGSTAEPMQNPVAPGPAVENSSRNPQLQIPAADSVGRNAQATGGESSNLITNYFPLPQDNGNKQTGNKPSTNVVHQSLTGVKHTGVYKNKSSKRPRGSVYRNPSGVPAWMCIPGTPFRVDAFQHLSGDCSHWFLTHFHTDHYQGLTRGFRYGHIFCSLITARLVNLRIGVSWDKLMIIPLNEKFKIAGVDVTFIDANHCPGSVMILFEPPNGEAVLHTGDFRFCTEMANNSLLQTVQIHTLVLDTTYCDPQYDFPIQATVIQFVIEAIQAELFNSDTLFLIGTYTIGKERIFLEVAKVLKKYVYIGAPKKKLLDCMDLPADDTKWLTCNEHESFIHVVPLWSISSFKRMNSISRHYQGRYKLIVAFSPSGWSFGRGKKKSPGKRWQQGTMIRYEVPYSEHCSFSELKEFLRFIGPEDIIPSVPGKSGTGADEMIASLWSEE